MARLAVLYPRVSIQLMIQQSDVEHIDSPSQPGSLSQIV